MNLEGIKNIIFDLGGVILNIDYQRAIDAFIDLGITREQLQYSQQEQDALFDQLEVGKISPDEFRDGLRALSFLGLTDEEIDGAWNALLLDLPVHRIELLKSLKDKYQLFMLSNTNAIHYEGYTENLRKEHGIEGLEPLFQKTYLSHEIGRRKPDVETFEWVCKDAGIEPSETLFIDDSVQHIEAASKVGLKTHWLKEGDVSDLFS
ncbi:MAG: HAD family hydrolase [Crocinitomicaceae bacterium]|nr:HAD family hydrolase [Crocinitomicaceae bacterium]|tara:strand:- start:20775 stop:21392 length:618 start_codon:yes stop_codon:yes gene_type:complete